MRNALTHRIVDLAGNPISAPMSRLNLPATIPVTAWRLAGLGLLAHLNLETDRYETTIDGSWLGIEGFDAIVPVAMVVETTWHRNRSNSVRGLIAALA